MEEKVFIVSAFSYTPSNIEHVVGKSDEHVVKVCKSKESAYRFLHEIEEREKKFGHVTTYHEIDNGDGSTGFNSLDVQLDDHYYIYYVSCHLLEN